MANVLDYQARRALLAVDRLVVRKEISPSDASHLREAITGASAGPTPTAIRKDAPPAPPTCATDVWLASIAEAQTARPGLTFVAASDAVRKAAPELYDGYLWEARHPGQRYSPPVQKSAPASYATILALVSEEAEAQRTSRDVAFCSLLKSTEGTPAFPQFHQAYRRYMRSDVIKDRDKAS